MFSDLVVQHLCGTLFTRDILHRGNTGLTFVTSRIGVYLIAYAREQHRYRDLTRPIRELLMKRARGTQQISGGSPSAHPAGRIRGFQHQRLYASRRPYIGCLRVELNRQNGHALDSPLRFRFPFARSTPPPPLSHFYSCQ